MTALGGLPWRVGHKVPEHIYDANETPLATMATPELAALVVGAVNAHAAAPAPDDFVGDAIRSAAAKLGMSQAVADKLSEPVPAAKEACAVCLSTHGPRNTNTLCPMASNYQVPAAKEDPDTYGADYLRSCAVTHDPDARLLGNMRASDIVAVCDAYAAANARVAELEAENARMQKMLDVCCVVHEHNVKLKARIAELEVAERLARATASGKTEALRQTDIELNKSRERVAELEADHEMYQHSRVELYRQACTPAERKVLEICSAALKAWGDRNPHDDFRFGMPDEMALGKMLELARRAEVNAGSHVPGDVVAFGEHKGS